MAEEDLRRGHAIGWQVGVSDGLVAAIHLLDEEGMSDAARFLRRETALGMNVRAVTRAASGYESNVDFRAALCENPTVIDPQVIGAFLAAGGSQDD